MGKKDSPNINAVGLLVDIINAIEKNCRGKAKELQIWKEIKLIEFVGESVEDLRYAIDKYTELERVLAGEE